MHPFTEQKASPKGGMSLVNRIFIKNLFLQRLQFLHILYY